MSNAILSLIPAMILRAPRKSRCGAMALALLACLGEASATDLTVHLGGTPSISRKIAQYRCDSTGSKIGVPAGPFSVEYINGGGNSLVVVPISGNSLIFTNVMSASGARYQAQQYTWWEAGGSVTLYSDSLAGKMESTCHPVKQ